DYEQGPWRLDELFSDFDAPEVQEALDTLEAQVKAFEAFRPQLEPDLDGAKFREILEAYERLVRQIARLGGYAHLRFAANTQDQQALTFRAQMQQLRAELENRTLFFQLWWKGLNKTEAQRLLDESGPYRYWLERLRLYRPYTLSEDEEKVINLKDVNGVQALITLYDSITSRYTFHLTVDGEEQALTRGELSVHFRSSNPDLRAAAYDELFRVYEDDASILGQIYRARVLDWRSENLNLRGFDDPMSVRNLANNVPDDVVDTLLAVSQDNVVIFQRYFELKARWLGRDQLRRYDVYAPVGDADKRYSFDDAVNMVLESYYQFEPEIGRLAQRVVDEQHIDSEVRTGKRGGAFCSTITPDLTPWVLQSYQGRPDDVATLAHELDHAVHSLLASGHTALTQRSSLPLAETASTFGEMLLIDRLLDEESDPSVQHTLLFQQMDDAYATIMRQIYFALFERMAHEQIYQGASVNDLSELYFQNLQRQFGDSLSLTDNFRHEWVVIPHIYHTPFYVYAYAFGQLLVFSLYQQYRQEGEAFKPRYIDILSAGGSDAPVSILRRAGIEVGSPTFWQGGYDVLRDLLNQLEALTVPEAAQLA
ncbi:MAG: M3 family oligoendopeptidase, partial [Candidatus Promineifilaceae bacterium]|nr:M3 family oligoendopeptidase [Candidatus Promineifilaceae bacterium]